MTMSFLLKLDSALNEMALSHYSTDFLSSPEVAEVTIKDFMGDEHEQIRVNGDFARSEEEAIKRAMDILAGRDGPEFYKIWGYISIEQMIEHGVKVRQFQTRPQFNDIDQKALGHRVTAEKIKAYLNDRSHYNWNVLILDRSAYSSNLKQHIQRNYPDIKFRGHITYVKTSSSGDILDADMLMHSIGHAALGPTSRAGDIKFKIKYELLKSVGMESAYYSLTQEKFAEMCKFLHFKAATNYLESLYNRDLSDDKKDRLRARSLDGDIDETVYELCAAYIRNNKVKFAPNKYHDNPESVAELANTIQTNLNALYKEALDICVGQVIWD